MALAEPDAIWQLGYIKCCELYSSAVALFAHAALALALLWGIWGIWESGRDWEKK